MNNHLTLLGVVTLIVTIDNALLCGLLLPITSRRVQLDIAVIVGTALVITQSVIAMGVGRILQNQVFVFISIIILIWMCVKTLSKESLRRDFDTVTATGSVFLYTLFGDLGNIIWLGSVLKGNYAALMVYSLCLIPVFVVVALFLAKQSEQNPWVLIVGAAMMAWVAGALFAETSIGRAISNVMSPLLLKVLFAALAMAFALNLRKYRRVH